MTADQRGSFRQTIKEHFPQKKGKGPLPYDAFAPDRVKKMGQIELEPAYRSGSPKAYSSFFRVSALKSRLSQRFALAVRLAVSMEPPSATANPNFPS